VEPTAAPSRWTDWALGAWLAGGGVLLFVLVGALRRLSVNAERLFGIRCTFEEVGEVLIDDNSVATHLFRIAQEAVSNAVKHGRAGQVKISLAAGRQIRLRIHDDGIGFPEFIDEEWIDPDLVTKVRDSVDADGYAAISEAVIT